MPTYYSGQEGQMTITGSGAPTSANCHRWAIFSAKPLADATPFAATDRTYVSGLKEHRFSITVFQDKAGTSAPLPSGTAFSFAGKGGESSSTNDYSWSGEIETARMGYDSIGGNRTASVTYEGRVNGAVTVA
jgi:hypothetical protein